MGNSGLHIAFFCLFDKPQYSELLTFEPTQVMPRQTNDDVSVVTSQL